MGHVLRIVGTSIATIGVLRLFRSRLKKWREEMGVKRDYVPHHGQIGIPLIVTGALSNPSSASPYVIGLGIGMLADDWVDTVEIYKPPVHVGELEELPYKKWYIEEKKITAPFWHPLKNKKIYNDVVDILKDMVNNDSYNPITKEVVPAGYRHPAVIWTTRKVLQNAGADSYKSMTVVTAIHDWVKANKTYVYDPMNKDNEDFYFHPYILLENIHEGGKHMIASDCDDLTTLTCSMLKSVGVPCGFMLYSQEFPGEYTHIIPAAKVDGEIIPLEVTSNSPTGWEPEYVDKWFVDV